MASTSTLAPYTVEIAAANGRRRDFCISRKPHMIHWLKIVIGDLLDWLLLEDDEEGWEGWEGWEAVDFID